MYLYVLYIPKEKREQKIKIKKITINTCNTATLFSIQGGSWFLFALTGLGTSVYNIIYYIQGDR